jgi:hypothetical protein
LTKASDKRLGRNGSADIKSHPFFKNINWNTLHTDCTPPFIPSIVSPDDVTFFSATNNEEDEDYQEDFDANDQEEESDMSLVYKEYPFIGYTYTSFTDDVPDPTESKSMTRSSNGNQEFIAKLRQKMTSSSPTQGGDELRELQKKHADEMSRLKEEHEAKVARLKSLIANKDLEFQQMQVMLKETQLQKEAASTTAKTYQEQYEQLQLKNVETQSMVERQSQQLKGQLTESNNRNIELQSLLDDAQDQVIKTKSEMSSINTAQERELIETKQKNAELQLQIQELETERNELKAVLETTNITTQSQETIDLQQQKLCQLEEELNQLKEMSQQYKTDILIYQQRNSQLMEKTENNSLLQNKTQAQLTNQITRLQDDLRAINEKLVIEQRNSTDLKEYYNNKLSQQSDDYNSLMEQGKSECTLLKNELALIKSTTQTMKRSNKSLPNMPTSDNLNYNQLPATEINSPGEGRSILSSIWKRDRESLKQVQEALDTSENQLAFAKRQVLRLKKEIKCLQKYSFEQKQKQMNDEHTVYNSKNNDAHFTDLMKNNMDHNQHNIQPAGHSKTTPEVPLQQHRSPTKAILPRVNGKTSRSLNRIYPIQNNTPTADSFTSKRSKVDLIREPKQR